MYKIENIVNTIICGNTLTELKKFPNESINCVITSPPYWALRDYQTEPQIWDGDKKCKHKWIEEITERPNASGGKSNKLFLKRKDKENFQEFVNYEKRETKSDFCSFCGAWRGSLGLEPTFELYIKHLCDIFDEVKRVLRKDGTCWVVIGDSYGGNQGKYQGWPDQKLRCNENIPQRKIDYPAKSLCLIPDRFRIEMVKRGWIIRNTNIWWKRNCMPSSAKDRFTIDYENVIFFVKSNDTQYWVNIKTGQINKKQPLGTKGIEGIDWYWKEIKNSWERPSRDEVFKTPSRMKSTYAKTKKKKVSYWEGKDYWFEQQYEPHLTQENRPDGIIRQRTFGYGGKYGNKKMPPKGGVKQSGGFNPTYSGNTPEYNSQGRNRRCVWDIPTKPFRGAHFAVFPKALVKPMILSGCPEFICKKCGKAREKIFETNNPSKAFMEEDERTKASIGFGSRQPVKSLHRNKGGVYSSAVYKGYTDCGCNAGWEGGVVLDPLGGSMTTGVVAKELGRNYILIDLKPEYCKIGEKRILNTTRSLF